MVDASEIFHPLRFAPREAFHLLGDAPRLEAAGVVLRMPASWRRQRTFAAGDQGRALGEQPTLERPGSWSGYSK